MTQVTAYTPEEFEYEYGTDDGPGVPTTGAMSALLRSAGELNLEVAPAPSFMRKDATEATGCRFIDSTYLLLDYLGCPPDAREFVLVICGLSGGDYLNMKEITQATIAKRMGRSTDYVKDVIDRLWTWEQHTNRMVVDIEQQEYDPAKRRFGTTKYRPVIVRYAAEFMRRIEARGLKPLNRQQAIQGNVEELYDEMADDIAQEMPEGPKLQRRKTKTTGTGQQRMSFIEGREERLLRAVKEWREALINSGYDAGDYRDELLGKIEHVIDTGYIT